MSDMVHPLKHWRRPASGISVDAGSSLKRQMPAFMPAQRNRRASPVISDLDRFLFVLCGMV
jgi:hypothetical protein